VEEAIRKANTKIKEAKTRVNASKARMIKAKIRPDFEATPYQMSKEQLAYHKNCVEHAEAINYVQDIQLWAQKYLEFLLQPNNENVRHDLDTKFLEWNSFQGDSFEDFIYTMNDMYLYLLLEDVEFPCNCGATDENYEDCLYFDTRPRRHIYMDNTGICSHGTKMTLVNKESLINKIGFINNKDLDILTLEVF
jgi:hypothetical protein